MQTPEQKSAWYDKNAPRILAKRKAQYQDPAFQADKKQYDAQHYQRNKVRKKEQSRNSRLKQFGLTPEQYESMVQAQDGLCAICKRPPEASDFRKKRLCIDHDHRTGKVRALLCHGCNVGLGNLQDSPAVLYRAIEYLNQHREG